MKRTPGLLGVALIALAGCGNSSRAFYVEVEAVAEVPPLIEPLPATVGVYYSPEFRAFAGSKTVRSRDSVVSYHFALGEPSTALFDWVMPAAFEKTLKVRAKPPLSGGAGDLDGVIEPRINGFTLTSISYEITLYAPSGAVIASLSANGSYPGEIYGDRRAMQAMSTAMRDASAAFLTKVSEQPQIKQWIADLDADRRHVRPKSDPGRQAKGALP